MIKIYNTFDVKSQKARIEKTATDPYIVHTEDYEDINDIIRRAVRTKTKPDFGPKVEGVEYDECLNEAAEEFEKLSDEAVAEVEEAAAEQSEDAASKTDADPLIQTQ